MGIKLRFGDVLLASGNTTDKSSHNARTNQCLTHIRHSTNVALMDGWMDGWTDGRTYV